MTRLLALGLAALASAVAAAGECQFGCCTACGRTCHLKVKQVTEDETCYEVDCKEVCIPAVRFPWESCRMPKCGRVRLVAKLREESREVKACEYEWVVTCPACETKAKAPKPAADSAVPPAPTEPPTPPAAEPAPADRPETAPNDGPANPFAAAAAQTGRSSTR